MTETIKKEYPNWVKRLLENPTHSNRTIIINTKDNNSENNKMCSGCNKAINHKAFKDELSHTESLISGLCQTCQNKIWS